MKHVGIIGLDEEEEEERSEVRALDYTELGPRVHTEPHIDPDDSREERA